MDTPPPRTGTTFLTDDDLLICDFLTLGRIPITAIRRADYAFHMNCGYTHSLNDRELVDHIHDLARLRLLAYRHCRRQQHRPKRMACSVFSNAVVYFNNDGADLWEQERNPDWQRFICHLPGDAGTMTVASLSKTAIQDYLTVGHATRRFQVHSASVDFAYHEQMAFFYWGRTFRDVYTATVKCTKPDRNEILYVWDAATHEANRTWWTQINAPPARKAS